MFDYVRSKKSSRYSLDEFETFLDKIKFSFDIPTIHVTATNGKGSIVNYLSHIYLEAGYKVGSFISPTPQPNQMILVNNIVMPREDFNRLVNEHKKLFEKYDLSEFEIETFIALSYFKEMEVDLCIIEVGMGGLIDATNIIESTILSIVGRISNEHSIYLGRSESEIAKNKAGIIKYRIPALSIRQNEGINYAIKEEARVKKSELHYILESHDLKATNDGWKFNYGVYKELETHAKPQYQVENACVAIEAVNILKEQFPVSESALRQGILCPPLDARYTILDKYPRIIVDGAHNPQAIETLIKSLLANREKVSQVLMATFKDKNVEKMLAIMSADYKKIMLTTFENERARDEFDYFLFLEDYKFVEDYRDALAPYLDNNVEEGKLVVCGSLDFAYLVLDYLRSR